MTVVAYDDLWKLHHFLRKLNTACNDYGISFTHCGIEVDEGGAYAALQRNNETGEYELRFGD